MSQLKIEQEAVLRRLEAERNRLVKDLANAEEKGEDREKGGCSSASLPLLENTYPRSAGHSSSKTI